MNIVKTTQNRLMTNSVDIGNDITEQYLNSSLQYLVGSNVYSFN